MDGQSHYIGGRHRARHSGNRFGVVEGEKTSRHSMNAPFDPLPRASHLAALIVLLTLPFPETALAQDPPLARPAPMQQSQGEGACHPLARWFDAQTFTVSGRYDYIEDAGDRTVQNRMQWHAQMHGAFKVDASGCAADRTRPRSHSAARSRLAASPCRSVTPTSIQSLAS